MLSNHYLYSASNDKRLLNLWGGLPPRSPKTLKNQSRRKIGQSRFTGISESRSKVFVLQNHFWPTFWPILDLLSEFMFWALWGFWEVSRLTMQILFFCLLQLFVFWAVWNCLSITCSCAFKQLLFLQFSKTANCVAMILMFLLLFVLIAAWLFCSKWSGPRVTSPLLTLPCVMVVFLWGFAWDRAQRAASHLMLSLLLFCLVVFTWSIISCMGCTIWVLKNTISLCSGECSLLQWTWFWSDVVLVLWSHVSLTVVVEGHLFCFDFVFAVLGCFAFFFLVGVLFYGSSFASLHCWQVESFCFLMFFLFLSPLFGSGVTSQTCVLEGPRTPIFEQTPTHAFSTDRVKKWHFEENGVDAIHGWNRFQKKGWRQIPPDTTFLRKSNLESYFG